MINVHLPQKFNLRGKNRTRVLTALACLMALSLVFTVSTSAAQTNNAPAVAQHSARAKQALPAETNPAPPPEKKGAAPAVPRSTTPTTAAPATPVPTTTKRTPAKSTTSAKPTLSKSNKEALGIVDYWWDTFVLAMKKTKGTKLTADQLRKPQVVIVSKASCKQPKSNLLGPKSHKSFTYCDGKLELVPDVFLTITDPGKLRVVASGFLYHALANTPDRLRDGRNNAAVLGCLQGGLVSALLQYQAINSDQDAWVVISPISSGEDLHNGYIRTLEAEGRWS